MLNTDQKTEWVHPPLTKMLFGRRVSFQTFQSIRLSLWKYNILANMMGSAVVAAIVSIQVPQLWSQFVHNYNNISMLSIGKLVALSLIIVIWVIIGYVPCNTSRARNEMLRRNLCPHCAYQINGLRNQSDTELRCPECGTMISVVEGVGAKNLIAPPTPPAGTGDEDLRPSEPR